MHNPFFAKSHNCVNILGADSDSWAPAGVIPANAGWAPADSTSENNPESGGWNSAGWTQDQSVENVESQGWTGDAAAPNEDAAPGWDNSGDEGWNSQNQNTAGWANVPTQGPPPPTEQSPNSWQPQGNGGGGGAWIVNPQQGDNGQGGWAAPQQSNDGQGGWVGPQQPNNAQGGWPAPQQGGGWNSQSPQGNSNGNWNSGGSWGPPPAPTTGNSWQNSAPTQPSNGGWNNGPQNAGGWNDGSSGSSGWQDGNLSWKVYNEDTNTMENLDDNSGWKVVGDGGPEGWKLVDENGKVEWKIENINGEWKVTSADEFSSTNDTTPSTSTDPVNATADATNDTSTETTTGTPAPAGGWDDDKQGRYIIWKFSDDGKGEARVYGGPGTNPEVWTVGDNNEWWKASMGVKGAGTVVKGGYNDGSNNQGNGGWQNAAPQLDNTYQNGGSNIPDQNGWQDGGTVQNAGADWQQNAPPVNGGGGWRNNGPAPPTGGWQTRGAQRGNSGWQNNGGPAIQQKWNNGVSPTPQTNGWQNPTTQSGNWNTGGVAPPGAGGWPSTRPQSQPQRGNWQRKVKPQQSRWQNGATRNGGRWANGGPPGGRRGKGRWRGNGNRPSGRWVSNNAKAATRNATPKGRVWNSGNGWRTASGVQQQAKPGWVTNPHVSSGAPPVATTSGRTAQNDQDKTSQATAWSRNGRAGQTVPYIIVIKAPDTGTTGAPSHAQVNGLNVTPASKESKIRNEVKTRPQSNRRNGGWKMNRAGSSGWQWNPQGGSEGWQWRDGWMGSGGGFGGWTNDKGTMYSSWKPTSANNAQARKTSSQRNRIDKENKKSASKMVFVFGTKRSSGDTNQPVNKSKKGKQVIIIDYTSGSKTLPKGDEGMKKDIASVIQALKTAKPTGVRGTAIWKQPVQKRKTQQWSRS